MQQPVAPAQRYPGHFQARCRQGRAGIAAILVDDLDRRRHQHLRGAGAQEGLACPRPDRRRIAHRDGRGRGAAASGRSQPDEQCDQVHRIRSCGNRRPVSRDRRRGGASRNTVTDTGIGIAPDRIGCLFSDFLQVNSSINRRYGGTGLGLAISKRIIQQMGGEIRAESTLNAGSTFRFTLTLPTADIAELVGSTPEAAENEFERKLLNLGPRLAVLLAEDNATNQLVFTKLMQATASISRWRRMAGSRCSTPPHRPSTSCSWICACPKWTGSTQPARSARSMERRAAFRSSR